jgi:hypothetical protein
MVKSGRTVGSLRFEVVSYQYLDLTSPAIHLSRLTIMDGYVQGNFYVQGVFPMY